MGNHNFDDVFYKVFEIAGDAFNKQYQSGIPIAALNPQLAMIGGLIKNSTMSPYISDGWLYAGFSMQADAPYYHHLYETNDNVENKGIFVSEEEQFLQ